MSISIDGSGSISGVSSLSNPSNIVVGTGVSIVSPSANELSIRTNGADRIYVGSGGDIDIGKETSGRKTLILNSQDDGAAILFRADAATRARIEVENGSTDLVFGVETAVTPTTRLRIDSSGRVTMPYQPAFSAYRTGNQTGVNMTAGNTSVVIYNTTNLNIGNHYNTSTGLFTAPVTGTYAFSAGAYTSTSIIDEAWWIINGGRTITPTMTAVAGNTNVGKAVDIIYLSANDTIGLHLYDGGGETNATVLQNQYHTYFKGYFMG